MTLIQLARLGRDMRDAQRRFFTGRRPADLDESKRLEREFDRACRRVLDGSPTLFDREDARGA